MDLKIEPELERCLPPLPEIQYQKLKASIEKKYDPAKPIVLWLERPRTIVDGHHRYRACQESGQEPVTVEESFESLDAAILYTLQRQTETRDLTAAQKIDVVKTMMQIEDKIRLEAEAQKARFAGRPASAEVGNPGLPTSQREHEVAKQIAKRAGTSRDQVYKFQAVEKNGLPELTDMMKAGEIGAKSAHSFIREIPDVCTQKEIIKSGGVAAVKELVGAVRKEEEAEREASRQHEAQRIAALRNTKTAIEKDVKEFNEYVRDTFGDADNICIRGAKVEMWCSDCKWGFDTYNPNTVQCCPYCTGKNIVKRVPDWWPGKKVI